MNPKKTSNDQSRILKQDSGPYHHKSSSHRKANSTVYSDRFIPSRRGSHLHRSSAMYTKKKKTSSDDTSKESTAPSLALLLHNELLGEKQPHISSTKRSKSNVFRFQAPKPTTISNSAKRNFVFSPLTSTKLLSCRNNVRRKIGKSPFKVLDAPGLQDDFYLNLVDWSKSNVLAVGLTSCVYLWGACTSKVTKLCALPAVGDSVTSVAWNNNSTTLAVGTDSGDVQIWDPAVQKLIRTYEGHSARVGTLAWNGQILATASRDRNILLRDLRSPSSYFSKLKGHTQEVCGLKWSYDNVQLASGGNDNTLMIWSARRATAPVFKKLTDHCAAVKAIAWSPHQHGLLASGGGTADRSIRFWNSLSNTSLNVIDTGSQVCNLMWSSNVNEIVSTHGYSMNQVIVWKYPSMKKVATLTGHTYRVLYLAMSPDGSSIVTGAGDETLRFWNIFPGAKKGGPVSSSQLLFPLGRDIR